MCRVRVATLAFRLYEAQLVCNTSVSPAGWATETKWGCVKGVEPNEISRDPTDATKDRFKWAGPS